MPSVQSHSISTINENEKEDAEETEKLVKPEIKEQKKVYKDTVEAIENSPTSRKNIYWKYITAGGSWVLPFITFVAFVIAQLMCSSCDYFIKYW